MSYFGSSFDHLGTIFMIIFLSLVGWGLFATYQWVTTDTYQDLIDVCEADLPRTKRCELKAVPANDN